MLVILQVKFDIPGVVEHKINFSTGLEREKNSDPPEFPVFGLAILGYSFYLGLAGRYGFIELLGYQQPRLGLMEGC